MGLYSEVRAAYGVSRVLSLMCTVALATLWSVVFLSRTRLSKILKTGMPPGVDGIGGVTHDSRLVEPGFVFVAIPGMRLADLAALFRLLVNG